MPAPNTQHPTPSFPATRLRRTRMQPWSRALVAEHRLHPSDLILPLFVQEGTGQRTPIASLPGVERQSIDVLVETCREAAALGIPAVALFPVTPGALKNDRGTEALNPDNLVCHAIRAIKHAVPDLGIIADVALDPYTSHGQDGIVMNDSVDNDETIAVLAQQATILAAAGCDIVAPSDMMDGRVAAIREQLERHNHKNTLILAYASKYASALYGPFRDAVDSAQFLGSSDKRGYQMDSANSDEALREIALDIQEGADIVMIKPATFYLDIIRRAKDQFHIPIFAYQVSGEYAMIHAAAAQGMLNADAVMHEALLACKRAGASAIFTYAALTVARALQ